MSDYIVAAGSTARLGRVEGALRAGRNSRIVAESGRRVVVTEGAYLEGPVSIECDFECKSMRVEGKGFGPSGNVEVRGSLLVHGDLEIDASAEVGGEISAERVDVGGHLKTKSITSKGVRVGGHLETRGSLKAEDVDVGGHMNVGELVDISNLRVGGHVEVGGGTIKGDVKVRGRFRAASTLAYGSIQVYGSLVLPRGSRGDKLRALGKVEFEGDGFCKEIEINGTAKARGDLGAEKLQVNGKLEVQGSLKVSEKLEVFGSAEAKKTVECGGLGIWGRLAAERIVASGRAEVGGETWVPHGLMAKDLAVGTGSRVNGPIVADAVEVGVGLQPVGLWAQISSWRTMGRMTRVDDVYARDVRVDRYSQVKRVYAETIRMQSGSAAAEVNFTKEADISEGVHLEKPSRKTDSLPIPPS